MLIEVWSDVVCPWCFIGHRRLEKAIAKLPRQAKIEVRHRAFQLQPEINEVVATKDYLSAKYQISPEQVAQMQANVCEIADGEGLCYQLDQTLSGNTKAAHQLLSWSRRELGNEKAAALLELMFSTYFEKRGELFSIEALTILAAQVGITGDQVKSALADEEIANEVVADQDLARQLGANGVPFFVLDMKYGISGAQPQEIFDQTLAQALAESH
jgi:predicted DsbA family dithiol-disulfide isomerase